MDQRVSKRRKFKVPKQVRSLKTEQLTLVTFKNLTNDVARLYWIDFNGKPILYGELNPMNRSDSGLSVSTFVTHPWVAVSGNAQLLLNGKRYFYPLSPESWNCNLSQKWNKLIECEETQNDRPYEVLILSPSKLLGLFLWLFFTKCNIYINI